jgi:tetratricopeptide (TPR) repeat protein
LTVRLPTSTAIRLDPKNELAYYNRGLAYNKKGEHDRAIADLDEAIRLNPQDAEPYVGRGEAYASKDELDRAIADLDEAIRLNPKFATAYNARGLAYYSKGDYARAIADYDQALTLALDRTPGPSWLRLADEIRGNRDRAQTAIATPPPPHQSIQERHAQDGIARPQ